MKSIAALVQRNLTIYFRDPAGVFLSLLSAIILLLLYVLFLGGLQTNAIRAQLPLATDDQVSGFVNTWVFAGIVTITTLTTSLGAVGTYVDDKVTGRFKEFRVCPIRSSQMVLGYQITAFLVSAMMSTIVLIIGCITMGLLNSVWLSPANIAMSIAIILLEAFAFAAFASFLITFITSHAAYTAVSTIIGTILGFLAGAYLPVGLLSERVSEIVNMLPFSPAAMLLRGPIAGHTLEELSAGTQQAHDTLSSYYGFQLSIGELTIEPWLVVVELLLIMVVFISLGSIRLGRTIK